MNGKDKSDAIIMEIKLYKLNILQKVSNMVFKWFVHIKIMQ